MSGDARFRLLGIEPMIAVVGGRREVLSQAAWPNWYHDTRRFRGASQAAAMALSPCTWIMPRVLVQLHWSRRCDRK